MEERKKTNCSGCLSLLLLFILLVGFTACKDPSSSSGETYTVTFDTTGGNPVPQPLVVPAGSKIQAPDGIIKSYYTLGGWYRDLDFKELWDFENDVVTCDITLYARWGTVGSGGSGSFGGGGNSVFGQLVMYRETIDTLGIIEIDIKHKNSQGPAPRNGDTYTITLEDEFGNITELSSGTIQIVDGHVVFIPEGAAYSNDHPFMGDFDPHNKTLSVDYIPHSPEDISVPGAAYVDKSGKLEGLDDDHVTYHHISSAEHNSLDSFVLANIMGTFTADPIVFNNQTTKSPVYGSWTVGYNEGYYGWEREDMYEIHATPVPGGSLLSTAISLPQRKGRGYYGEWKLGQSVAKNDLNVEIREDQKTSLQFKNGGAPYKLDLNADFGHGFTVGYIEITASGQTNIVTLKVHLNDGYRLDGSDPVIVEWYTPNTANLPNHLKSPVYPYFKIPNAETTVVYTGVPSNISFKGAKFKVLSKDAAHSEHAYQSQPGGTGNLFFVSEEDPLGNGNTIIVAAPNGITSPLGMGSPYNLTVEEYGNEKFEDHTDHTIDSPGWIFVDCATNNHPASCTLCNYYYIGPGTPSAAVPVNQIIEYPPNPDYYKIETDGSGTTFYYDEYTHRYYMWATDFNGPNGEQMIADPEGPYFFKTTHDPSFGPLNNEYVHAKDLGLDLIVHAVHNDALKVNGYQVGVVHVEYNRYEPDINPLSINYLRIPYTVTITYDFDADFLGILDQEHPGWSYTCTISSSTITSNGSSYVPDSPFPLTSSFASHPYINTIKGTVLLEKLPLTSNGEKLMVELEIETKFYP